MVTSSAKFGVVTFWTLGTTNYDDLVASMEAIGMKELVPRPATPLVALYNALHEKYPDHLIRQLKSPGFAVVKEDKGETDNSYETLCTAKINDDENKSIEASAGADTAEIYRLYRKHRQLLPAAAVGKMLSDVCAKRLSSTMLRPTGGIYWFSSGNLDTWQSVAETVEKAGPSNRIYVLRHDLDSDAIRAVRDSLVAEITAEVQRLTGEIQSGELKEKALSAREKAARELADKVREYEGILGLALDELKKNLEAVETAAATAILLGAAEATGATANV